MPTDRLARGLKANLALEMLRSPTQVRKVTAVRREFVVRPLKWDTDLPLSRHFCAARHRRSRKSSRAVSEADCSWTYVHSSFLSVKPDTFPRFAFPRFEGAN